MLEIIVDLSIVIASLFALIAYWFKNYQRTKIDLRHCSSGGILIPVYAHNGNRIPIGKNFLTASFTYLNVSADPSSLIDLFIEIIDNNDKVINHRLMLENVKVNLNSVSESKYIINVTPPFSVESLEIKPRTRLIKELLIGYNDSYESIKSVAIQITVAEKTIFYPFKKTRKSKFLLSKEDIDKYTQDQICNF